MCSPTSVPANFSIYHPAIHSCIWNCNRPGVVYSLIPFLIRPRNFDTLFLSFTRNSKSPSSTCISVLPLLSPVRATSIQTLSYCFTEKYLVAGLAAAQITPNVAGSSAVGAGDGSQFITGGCVADADCSSACCADASGVGVCSAEAAQFQNGKNGCGFEDPNAAATIEAAQAQVAQQGFRRVVRKRDARKH